MPWNQSIPFRDPGLWLNPLAVFSICLITYVLTLPLSITLEDAGLFQLVCHLGGISHPPGYPLFTLLCQPFVQLPIFEPGVFAGNFLNALFASLAAALFHHICFRLMNRRFAWLAALSFGLSATYWSQAIIIEVYSLSVLLFLLCLGATLKYLQTGEIKYWYALGLFYGLALSNHWPLTGLSTPVLLLLLSTHLNHLKRQWLRPQFWLLSIFSLSLGLLPYLSLITNPEPTIGVYGGIHSSDEFIKYVSRAAYSDGSDIADLNDKFNYGVWLLKQSLTQMGTWAVPVIMMGLWLSFRKLPLLTGSSLMLLYLGSTYLLLALLNFDFEPFRQSIFKPYPVIAYLAVAVWFALGVEEISAWIKKFSSVAHLAVLISITAISLVAISNFNENNRGEDSFVETYATTLLQTLPENSILFVNGDFEATPFGYLTLVKGIRPDIEIREWENLVFNNRLVSATAPEDVRDEASTLFLRSTSRPVFSLLNRFRPTTSYGAYFRLNTVGESAYAINPTMDGYLQHLIYLYNNGLINDAHEQVLAFSLLINFSKAYLGYADQSASNKAEVATRILQLETTFPGRLISIEKALAENDPGMRARMLELASLAEKDIPNMISNKNLAIFHEYYGQLLAQDQTSMKEAIEHLEKSISIYPASENASICKLKELVDERHLEPPKLLEKFPLDDCGNQPTHIAGHE